MKPFSAAWKFTLSLCSTSQQITFVDFIMYELLDQHRMFQPTCLDNFQNLKDFLARFEVRILSC